MSENQDRPRQKKSFTLPRRFRAVAFEPQRQHAIAVSYAALPRRQKISPTSPGCRPVQLVLALMKPKKSCAPVNSRSFKRDFGCPRPTPNPGVLGGKILGVSPAKTGGSFQKRNIVRGRRRLSSCLTRQNGSKVAPSLCVAGFEVNGLESWSCWGK